MNPSHPGRNEAKASHHAGISRQKETCPRLNGDSAIMAYRTRILDRMMPDIGFSLYATYYYHIVFADKTNIPVFYFKNFCPPPRGQTDSDNNSGSAGSPLIPS